LEQARLFASLQSLPLNKSKHQSNDSPLPALPKTARFLSSPEPPPEFAFILGKEMPTSVIIEEDQHIDEFISPRRRPPLPKANITRLDLLGIYCPPCSEFIPKNVQRHGHRFSVISRADSALLDRVYHFLQEVELRTPLVAEYGAWISDSLKPLTAISNPDKQNSNSMSSTAFIADVDINEHQPSTSGSLIEDNINEMNSLDIVHQRDSESDVNALIIKETSAINADLFTKESSITDEIKEKERVTSLPDIDSISLRIVESESDVSNNNNNAPDKEQKLYHSANIFVESLTSNATISSPITATDKMSTSSSSSLNLGNVSAEKSETAHDMAEVPVLDSKIEEINEPNEESSLATDLNVEFPNDTEKKVRYMISVLLYCYIDSYIHIYIHIYMYI